MYAPAVLESKTRVTTDQDVGRKAITRIRRFARIFTSSVIFQVYMFSMMLARREVTDFGNFEKILWGSRQLGKP
jgi:hypothetical protein